MAQCKSCKAVLPEGVDFCEKCGAPIDEKKKKSKAPGPFGFKDNESIEAEAKAWTKETGSLMEEPETAKPSVPNSPTLPDKRMVPSAVFIARTKNGAADKFFGFMLFIVVLGIIAMAFMLNTGLMNFDGLLTSVNAYLPLLMLALGAIVIARTGSFDFALPVISVVTYYMLSAAFSETNLYPIMVLVACVALFIGLIVGLLTVVGKVPAAFSSFSILFLGIVYLKVILGSDTPFMDVAYTDLSVKTVPLLLAAVSIIAVFILIYMTNLGKSLYKRKGITGKNKGLYILSFAFAYFLAAGGGILASIHTNLSADFSSALFYTFDLVLGILFIVALSGASTFFDNRSMPVLLTLVSFFAWFGVCFVLQNSVGKMQDPLVAYSIKIAFVLLALIADRVYTKTHIGDFYQTIYVKK